MPGLASQDGLAPQRSGLERPQEHHTDRGCSVLGFPSNQFAGQEPGASEEIATFCAPTYGVGFPLFEKTDVNGAQRHPRYAEQAAAEDAAGRLGMRRGNSTFSARSRKTSTAPAAHPPRSSSAVPCMPSELEVFDAAADTYHAGTQTVPADRRLREANRAPPMSPPAEPASPTPSQHDRGL
ncbi:hypothetical protein ACFVTP_08235 [Streptomyces celluloflavus]|uniref:hypothetical protein n=1 Tax=Streptomyces celluloflavus TaxID=58344 RepID=UPI0036DBFFC8